MYVCVCVCLYVAKVADAAAEADAAERTNRGKMEKIQIGQDVSVCVPGATCWAIGRERELAVLSCPDNNLAAAAAAAIIAFLW